MKRRAQIGTALYAIKPKRLSAMLVSCESHGGFVYPTCTRKQLKWPTSRSLSPTGASNMTQALSFLSQATSTWRWRRHPYAQTDVQHRDCMFHFRVPLIETLQAFVPIHADLSLQSDHASVQDGSSAGKSWPRFPSSATQQQKSSATTTTTTGIRSTC